MIKNRILPALLVSGLAPALHADWLETADGALDQTWAFAGVDFTFTNAAPFTQSISGANRLRLESVANPPTGTAAAFGTVTTESFTDVLVTAEVRSNSDNFYGVGLRSNGAGDAYLFLINPHLGHAEIVEVGSSVAPSAASEIATSAGFAAAAGDFYIEFEAIGTQLTGRVYDDVNGNLLATATTNDASYTSGFSGIFASFNQDVPGFAGQDTDANWDNITSAVIPEPTSLALLTLGGLLTARRRRA